MTIDLIAEQDRIEGMMRGLTVNRFMEGLAYKLDHQNEAATYYGVTMLKRAIEPLKKAIEEFIEEAEKGGPGRRHGALKHLQLVEADVVAYMTSKVVLDQITLGAKLPRAALGVGKAIEDELRWRRFDAEQGHLFRRLQEDHGGEMERRKRSVFVHAFNKYVGEWDDWSQRDKIHLGMLLIEMFIRVTGFAEVVTRYEGKNRTVLYLTATEKVLQWVESSRDNAALLTPVFLPMVVPPTPWTSPQGGGYMTHYVRPISFVKTPNRNYLTELEAIPEQMAPVYHAVNVLQAVRWQINRGVLDTMRSLWDQGVAVAKLPPRDPQPIPPSPFPPDKNTKSLTPEELAVFKVWKRKATRTYDYNNKLKARRMQTGKVIAIAQQFCEYEAIYFPYTLDFRGRAYAVPMFLNPQGHDQAKGLLRFADGKPLGSERAAGWLAIHGANVWGEDKVSLEDRISWVEERSDKIEATGNDPLADLWWTKADKPWCFLAFCIEWAGYCREGLSFKSHLPIAMDGSCSGLQHFSAALRDPVGGAAVNLVPSDKPSDVYQEVMDKAEAKLRLDLTKGEVDEELAAACFAFGLTRKTAKRATMTVPYGSTRYSCRDFVAEYIHETTEERKEKDRNYVSPLVDKEFDASLLLSHYIWEAIGETVIAAREAMDWLRGTARVLAKEELPVTWVTPDGLPIIQAYMDTKHRRVKTKFGDQLVYLTLAEDAPGDGLDARRQANGVAPNWVHSQDGCHLRMAVNLAFNNGVDAFAVVHDSFGTHACDTDMLSACLRETFVDLYAGNVLANFAKDVSPVLSEGASLPELPPMGTLDLELVKQSDFVFA